MKKLKTLLLALPFALATTVAVALIDVDTRWSTCTLFYVRDTLKAARLDALLSALLLAALWVFYARFLPARCQWRRGDRLRLTLVSLFFALVMTLGPIYRQGEAVLLGSAYHALLLAGKLCGWTPFFWVALKTLFIWLGRAQQAGLRRGAPPTRAGLRRVFLCTLGVLLLCWAPLWIVRYPAALGEDESRALQMIYGGAPWTDDHPYAYTLVVSAFMRFGLLLGDANIGAALFACAQAVFMATALACTVREMARAGLPRWTRVAVVCLYAVGPLYAHFAFIIMKDVLYTAAFVCYTLVVWRGLTEPEESKKRPAWWTGLMVFSLMLLLLRHNGRMVVYPMSVLLLIRLWRGSDARRRVWQGALLAAPVALALLFNAAVVAPGAIHVDSTPDVLGVPLQQTALIARNHGDVTEDERAAIDALVEYDQLAGSYTSTSTDRVKRLYRFFDEHTAGDKLAFTRAWLGMAARHPGTAIHAELALNGGFLDPLADGTGYIDDMVWDSSDKYVRALALEHPEWTRALRERVSAAESIWRALPGVELFGNVGTYVWLLMIAWLIARRIKRGLGWALLPAAMTLLACLLSAGFVNGTRYAFPIVYTAPFLAAMLGWQAVNCAGVSLGSRPAPSAAE